MSAFPPPTPPPQPQQAYYDSPQPPPAQESGTGCLKFGVAGCVGALAMIGIALVAFFFLLFTSLKGRPYAESLSRARTDPRVIEDLGTPIKPGFMVGGSMKTGSVDGSADLNYSLSGPKGDGSMHVVATRNRGVWTYKTMVVHTAKRDIDLLSP